MRPMQVLPHCELLKGEGESISLVLLTTFINDILIGKGVQCNGCEHGKLNG